MEATNYFHVLPCTSMMVGSRPASTEVALGWGLGLGLELRLRSVLRKQLELCATRGSRWKYVGVYGSSWKLPRNRFVEAAINGSNGSFHFHWQWKLQCTPMKASTNCHGSKNTSTNFHRISLEVNLLPPISMEVFMKINRLPWKWFTSTEPWKLWKLLCK